MASIIQSYEYDIFISYRQKDNKGDKWVSRFVEALKTELEASFKEDIRVYFDENPHDRLQDTHDVDKSLEVKLKCLIFIPILSQTYCDPASYAWQSEFLAFIKITDNDGFGKNIRLRNGNYASRILPVRIHDLEQDDIKLFETETGSALRALDFVFKTASGVNRPLKSTEDHPLDNLNKTFYNDQINRVANAIKEIIAALKSDPESKLTGESRIQSWAIPAKKSTEGTDINRKRHRSLRKWFIISIALALCIIGAFFIYNGLNHAKQSQNLSGSEKSIAVLPFANDSPDKENEYFCNGMMEEILNQLQKISELRVKDRTSVEKYRNSDKDIKVIGLELGASLIMEGSVRKIGEELRIHVQLIDTKTGDHLWSEIYDGKYTTKIFEFQSNIAKKVAVSLNAVITPQEEKRIDVKPTSEMLAFDLCSRGRGMIFEWYRTQDSLYLRLALNLFNQALKIDPNYIDAIDSKGFTYATAGKYDSAMIMYDKVQVLDPAGYHSAAGKGLIYFFTNKPDSAFKYWKINLDMAPNDLWVNFSMGQLYFFFRNDISNGLSYWQKSYNLGGDKHGMITENIAALYYSIGNYAKALKYLDKSIFVGPGCDNFITYSYILSAQGNYKEALQYLDSICNISDCEQKCDIMKFHLFLELKEFKKAEAYYNQAVSSGYKQTGDDDLFIACLYNETGRKKEALSILNNFIRRNENLLNSSGPESPFETKGFQLSAAYSMIGEKKKALKYLIYFKAKMELRSVLINPRSFPGFDSIRSEPEFKEFLQRLEDEKSAGRAQVRDMEQRGEINL